MSTDRLTHNQESTSIGTHPSNQWAEWIRSMSVNGAAYGSYRIAETSTQATLLSSCFAALALELPGALARLSSEERKQWASSIADHQNPENGFFDDPLMRPEDMAGTHHDWHYLTWQTTFFSVAALDALGARPRYRLAFVDDMLAQNDLSTWLATRCWSDPWLESNNIMFLLSFLLQMGAWCNDPSYVNRAHAILDWLDLHQNPATGYWDLNQGASLYNAMAGAFHFYFFYFYLGRPVQYVEQIIDSTLSLQQSDGLYEARGGGGACIDLDAIDILVKFSLLTDHRAADVKTSLTRSFSALRRNQNTDGGFCEAKRPDLWPKSKKRLLLEAFGLDRVLRRPWQGRPVEYLSYSSWERMRYRVDESDLWSTWFRPLSLALICTRYPAEFPSDTTWRFRRSPALGWHDIVKMQQIRAQFYS